MLRFNPEALTPAALKKAVTAACAPFGGVTAIKIYPPTGQAAAYRYAFVEMNTPEQVKTVAQKLGEILFGDMAVIRLEFSAD